MSQFRRPVPCYQRRGNASSFASCLRTAIMSKSRKMNTRYVFLLASASAVLLCVAAENDPFTRLVENGNPHRDDMLEGRTSVSRFIIGSLPQNQKYELDDSKTRVVSSMTRPYRKEYGLDLSTGGVTLCFSACSVARDFKEDMELDKVLPPGYLRFSIEDAEKLSPLFQKFTEWTAISKQEQLTPDLRKPMGQVGKYSFFFRTPDLLEVSKDGPVGRHDIYAPSIVQQRDVNYLRALLTTLPDLKSELVVKFEAQHKARIERQAKEQDRTRKQRADEEKMKALLK